MPVKRISKKEKQKPKGRPRGSSCALATWRCRVMEYSNRHGVTLKEAMQALKGT